MNRRSFITLVSSYAVAAGRTEAATKDVDYIDAINVMDLGARDDLGYDSTSAFQNAIDLSSSRGGGKVFIPAGSFLISQLQIRSQVSIVGAGRYLTRLYSYGENGPVVSMSSGPVVECNFMNFMLHRHPKTKDSESPSTAIEFIARPGPNGNGGLWWSTFQNIRIHDFDYGIILRAGKHDFEQPHQFLNFRGIMVFLRDRSKGVALSVTGQVEHLKWEQCQFDSDHVNYGTLVSIGDGMYATRPTNIVFDTCTFQSSVCAVEINTAHNITFYDSWFENLERSFVVKSAEGLSIIRNRFANAAKRGAIISISDRSPIDFDRNVIAGAGNMYVIDPESHVKLDVGNNRLVLGARWQ